MKYILWIWRNMRGIRVNTVVRIVLGISQVSLGLLMVWLSKQFIDVTIRTGTNDDIVEMVGMLVGVVLLGILLRQAHYYMSMQANTSQSNTIRLRVQFQFPFQLIGCSLLWCRYPSKSPMVGACT